ncbi:MAG: M16 family metallopeptidase [Candidatus Limnocylindrus sp.]
MSAPHPIPLSERKLANGLRLITVLDRTTPTATVNLWYHVGSKDERVGRTGFAHLFEHLMFQGSANVSKAEHLSLIESVGGSANATTWLDRTNYFATVPAEWVELILWMEADRLGTLLDALDQANLDNQRDVVKNEKRSSYDNQPYGTAYLELFALAYPKGHPYHHPTIGSMEDLDAASLDDVRSFFSAWYAPNNAVLTVVGDIDEEEIATAVERLFGDIAANPDLPSHPDLTIPMPLGGEIRKVVQDKVPDPRIHIAYRAPILSSPDLPALEIAAQILAGGRGSRLTRRLVRQEQVAQEVGLSVLPFVGGASLVVGSATLRPGADAAKMEALFLEELRGLGERGPTSTEMERAHALIESEALALRSDPETIADQIGMYATLLNDPGRINRDLEIYRGVDAAAVQRVAKQYLAEDRVILWYEPVEAS